MEAETNNSEEQVLALLCGKNDPWTWGGDANQCRVSFERNGTGALNCGENQRSWIAVEFNWSFSSEPVRADTGTWTFAIRMTLATRLPPEYHKYNHWFKDTGLQEHLRSPPSPSEAPFPWAPLRCAAFRPKQYTLALSHGCYLEPFHLFIKPPFPILQSRSERFAPNRFSCQLVFDKSSYPPREEWAESSGTGDLRGSLDYHHYWERTEFVRGSIAKKDQTWVDTFDLGWWLSSSTGDGHWRGK